MTTVADIIADVITELSMVGGVSTQVYASPRIQQHIQDASILLMDEYWWPNLRKTFQCTIDGVTGLPNADLAVVGINNHKVTRFQDIQFVFQPGTNKPLAILPTRFNPFNLSGTSAVYIEPDSSYTYRPFRVWPLTTTDTVVVIARLYPVLPITPADTVYLDRLLLTYMAAYMYAEDDGTNPGQISKFKALFEKRLTQVKSSWEQNSVQLDTRFSNTEYEWSERE